VSDDPFAWLLSAASEGTTDQPPPRRRRVEASRDDDPMRWADDAACIGMDLDLFFPASSEYPDAVVAACKRCPVIAGCRDWALHNEDFGYWGGMTERARRRLRKTLNITIETQPDETTETIAS